MFIVHGFVFYFKAMESIIHISYSLSNTVNIYSFSLPNNCYVLRKVHGPTPTELQTLVFEFGVANGVAQISTKMK